MTLTAACPACRSTIQSVVPGRVNPWHCGRLVHFQPEPTGTPGAERRAACRAPIDDSPRQLAVELIGVSCSVCRDVAWNAVSCATIPPEPSR